MNDESERLSKSARRRRNRRLRQQAESTAHQNEPSGSAGTVVSITNRDAAALEFMKATLQARHVECLDWVLRSLDLSPGAYLAQVLRAAIVKEYPAFREARGGGGSSSRNIQTLQERLR